MSPNSICTTPGLINRILREFFEKAMEINAIVLDIKDSAPNIS